MADNKKPNDTTATIRQQRRRERLKKEQARKETSLIQRSITPSDIEFLMHCHFHPEPHPRVTAPAIQSAIQKFTRKGLIKPCDETIGNGQAYCTTDLGKAWVNAICETPIPSVVAAEKGFTSARNDYQVNYPPPTRVNNAA